MNAAPFSPNRVNHQWAARASTRLPYLSRRIEALLEVQLSWVGRGFSASSVDCLDRPDESPAGSTKFRHYLPCSTYSSLD